MNHVWSAKGLAFIILGRSSIPHIYGTSTPKTTPPLSLLDRWNISLCVALLFTRQMYHLGKYTCIKFRHVHHEIIKRHIFTTAHSSVYSIMTPWLANPFRITGKREKHRSLETHEELVIRSFNALSAVSPTKLAQRVSNRWFQMPWRSHDFTAIQSKCMKYATLHMLFCYFTTNGVI